MERSIDDEAAANVRANIVIYEHALRWTEEAYDNGDDDSYTYYMEQADKAARRMTDLRGLTDEGAR